MSTAVAVNTVYSNTQEQEIRIICESLIGYTTTISFTMISPTGERHQGIINNCNIVGNCLEDIVLPIIQKKVNTFKEGKKQVSPDFYNNECRYELKTFRRTAGFDIGSITGVITALSLEGGITKKIFNTIYLVFEYDIDDDNNIILKKFWMLRIWDLCCGYGGAKPINTGGGKGVNIRPATKNQWTDKKSKDKRNPTNFLDRIESLIQSKWYKVDPSERKQNLESIKTQRKAIGC